MSQPVALFGLKVKPGDVHRIPMVFRDFKITNVSLGENVVGNKRVVVKVHHIPHYGHPAVEEEEIGDSDDDEDDDEEDSEEDAEEDDEDEDEDEDEEDEEEDSDDEDIRDALRAEKSYTERSFVLCTLIPGQREQATVDIAFTEDEDIGFSVVGDNEVDLLGNYTTPVGADQPPYSDEEEDSDFDDSEIDSDDIDGMDYDSDEYDSDEIDEDGLEAILAEEDSGLEDEDEEDEESDESKIEEIGAEPLTTKKSALKKRKAADEEPVEDVSMTAPVTDSEVAEAAAAEGIDVSKLTKAQRKRLNKKLKSATDAADDSVASTSSAPAVSKKESVKAAVVENGKAKTAAAETTAKDGKTVSQKKKLPSGLTIEVKKAGTGPGAKKGAKIGMRYIGKLASNGKVFDSNTKGKPFYFKLGRGEVIKAWDEGVLGMQVGEERRLTCPPSTAYGSRGAPPDIPGNSTLVFDIKCVSI